MAERRIPHLIQRGHVYYFRRVLPAGLAAVLGQREIKRSLETKNIVTARLRCRDLANKYDQLTVCMGAGMTADQIRELARRSFERRWAKGLELAYLAAGDPQFDHNFEISGLIDKEANVRKQIIARTYDPLLLAEARELLAEEANLAGKHISKDALDDFHHALLRARIEETRILKSMLQGRYDDTLPRDPLFAGMSEPPLPATPFDKPPTSPGLLAVHSLSDLVDKFCNLKQSTGKWVGKTYSENKRVLDWLVGFVGAAKPIKAVTSDDVRDFRDLIVQMPANSSKSMKFQGMTIREIAEAASDEPKLSQKTRQKYFFNVKAFFKWCVEEVYLTASPAGSIKLAGKINEKEARQPFALEILVRLFSSPQFVGHQSHKTRSKPGTMLVKDGKYWIPLIGLFSGMRLGEIVQLRTADVRQDGTTAYFAVEHGDDDDKQIKTLSSSRQVPVHSALIDMGFLAFVEKQKAKYPNGRIFEDVKKGSDGYYSHNFSKHFGRYLKDIEAKTGKTSFHSFRHNFADALRKANVQDSRAKALLGHADDSVTAAYGSGYTPFDLVIDIDRVNYGLDLSHLLSK